MNIADESGHRLLSYISAVTRRGATLTPDDLEEYARAPSRLARRTNSNAAKALATFASFFDGQIVFTETSVQHLERIRWITTINNSVKLTPIGHAILAELNEPKIETASESASGIILDPTDQFAYVRVIGALADIDDGLLVDPYFRYDQLDTIMEHTNIKRVLTSKKIGAPAIRQLSLALSVVSAEQRPEVRIADELHDRFAISGGEKVIAIGTSLNSVGKNLSYVLPLAKVAARAIRGSHEDLWSKSQIVEPSESGQTAPVRPSLNR